MTDAEKIKKLRRTLDRLDTWLISPELSPGNIWDFRREIQTVLEVTALPSTPPFVDSDLRAEQEEHNREEEGGR